MLKRLPGDPSVHTKLFTSFSSDPPSQTEVTPLDSLASIPKNKHGAMDQNLSYLRKQTLKGLCSVTIQRDLYKEEFDTCEQLQERILSFIAGQSEPYGMAWPWTPAWRGYPYAPRTTLHLPEPHADGHVHGSAYTAAENAGACQVPEPLGT